MSGFPLEPLVRIDAVLRRCLSVFAMFAKIDRNHVRVVDRNAISQPEKRVVANPRQAITLLNNLATTTIQIDPLTPALCLMLERLS